MYCPNCGNKLDSGVRYCSKCGKAISQERNQAQPGQPSPPPRRPAQAQVTRPKKEQNHSKQFTVIGIGVLIVILCAMTIGLFLQSQHKKDQQNRLAMKAQTATEEERFTPVVVTEAKTEKVPETESRTEERVESEPQVSSHALTRAFDSLTASSSLDPSGSITYSPKNVMDGKPETSWTEGVSGHGMGEWIKLEAGQDQVVTGINILAGYAKNDQIYKQNNRVKTLKVECSDGTSKVFTLEDLADYLAYQELEFDSPVRTKFIKLTIIDVYPGSKYEDTCISEITLY